MVRILDEANGTKPTSAPAPTCDICGCCQTAAQETPQIPQQYQTDNPAAGIIIQCPICECPLDCLDANIVIHRTAKITKNGLEDIDDEVVMQVFKCPDCGTILCDDEDDATDHVN